MGPVGAARVGRVNGEFVLNPTPEQMAESELDLIVAGTQEGVLMVESEANELPEDVMLEAVMFGWKGFQPVIDAIIDLAEKAAKEPWDIPEEDAEKKNWRKTGKRFRQGLCCCLRPDGETGASDASGGSPRSCR